MAFVNLAQDKYEHDLTHFSVTTLLDSTRQVMLKRRHSDEIIQDVSDMVWLVFGNAVHKILESHSTGEDVEVKLVHPITEKYSLSGRIDLFNEKTMTVEDYKTASVWKILHKDFEEWKLQGLMYAWLLYKTRNQHVERIRFHALLKDWTAKELKKARFKNEFYPETSIYTWEHYVTVQDIMFIDEFIHTRFAELISNIDIPDEQLPICTPEQRWNTGDKWAVIKPGTYKALRVFNSENEAKEFAGKDMFIEYRPGENRNCQDYCLVKEFCSFYHNNVKGCDI